MRIPDISIKDDLALVPSDQLNAKTMAAVKAEIYRKERRAVRPRTALLCAVLASAALMIMGMGYRVFDYLAYIPGIGIITDAHEQVCVLEHVVDAGGYTVEAASVIPIDEGEDKGKWLVTLMTDHPTDAERGEMFDLPPAVIRMSDGKEYSLAVRGGSEDGTRYQGVAGSYGAGICSVSFPFGEAELNMIPVKNSVYADYAYPTDQGITVICFPLSEGSDKLAMQLILEPESEEMKYWMEHAEYLSLGGAENMTVTDMEGNTYKLTGINAGSIKVARNRSELDDAELYKYAMETVLRLDRDLESPIASIDFDRLSVAFDGLKDTGMYTVTVPEAGETVPLDEAVIVDRGGIRITASDVSTLRGNEQNSFEEHHGFVSYADCWHVKLTQSGCTDDFEENVTRILMHFRWSSMTDGLETGRAHNGGGLYYFGGDTVTAVHEIPIYGDGSGEDKRGTCLTQTTFGDQVSMRPDRLELTVDGDWFIDFTETAESAETIE